MWPPVFPGNWQEPVDQRCLLVIPTGGLFLFGEIMTCNFNEQNLWLRNGERGLPPALLPPLPSPLWGLEVLTLCVGETLSVAR